jgi:predicted flap endonuclease-1-like 5' DNA nuclease
MNVVDFVKAIDGIAKTGDPVSDNLKSIFAAFEADTKASVSATLLQDYPVQADQLGITRTSTDAPIVADEPEAVVEVTADGKSSEEPAPLKGRLPDDFPGRTALAEAGVNTYNQLSKYADDYTQIPGIGPATAEKITEELGGS